MAKALFIPVSVGGGLLAGLLGKKLFEQIWGMIDKDEPPHPQHREISVPKMLIALALEGAIFRLTKGALDHWARATFARFTGTWPGEERPEPEPE
jgi:Protein of unknown function (DUF4235)